MSRKKINKKTSKNKTATKKTATKKTATKKTATKKTAPAKKAARPAASSDLSNKLSVIDKKLDVLHQSVDGLAENTSTLINVLNKIFDSNVSVKSEPAQPFAEQPKDKSSNKKEMEQEAVKIFTFDEVKQHLEKLATVKGLETCVEVLKKNFGAQKISDVDEKDFPNLMVAIDNKLGDVQDTKTSTPSWMWE